MFVYKWSFYFSTKFDDFFPLDIPFKILFITCQIDFIWFTINKIYDILNYEFQNIEYQVGNGFSLAEFVFKKIILLFQLYDKLIIAQCIYAIWKDILLVQYRLQYHVYLCNISHSTLQ